MTHGQVAYLGFAGHGNLGDDAIRDAITGSMTRCSVRSLPLTRAEVAKSLCRLELGSYRSGALFLGAGTALGRTIWHRHLKRSLRLVRPRPAFMLGAGVEDPAFK